MKMLFLVGGAVIAVPIGIVLLIGGMMACFGWMQEIGEKPSYNAVPAYSGSSSATSASESSGEQAFSGKATVTGVPVGSCLYFHSRKEVGASSAVGCVPYGTELEIIRVDPDGWAYARHEGKDGYISVPHLTFSP